jgi:uncharacterized metal-binding protein
MSTQQDCRCGDAPRLIFPCSGSADVGEIADRAARERTRTGAGKMSCLAGIGGGVSGMIESAKGATGVLAIDGCPIDCAKKTLQQAGITDFVHLRVTDHGMGKGTSAVTDETIGLIAGAGRVALSGR